MRKQSEFIKIVCGNCSYVHENVTELINRDPRERSKCPECQSKAWRVETEIKEEVKIYERVVFKFKNPGKKKSVWGVSGDEFYQAGGEWTQIERRFDRNNNQYDEVIKNSDGKVVREVHEPLTDHVDRGDARRKLKNKAK